MDSYEDIEPYIPEMIKNKVSKIARGEEKSSVTNKGFLELYNDPSVMYEIDHQDGSKTDNIKRSWGRRRDNFIARQYAQ